MYTEKSIMHKFLLISCILMFQSLEVFTCKDVTIESTVFLHLAIQTSPVARE